MNQRPAPLNLRADDFVHTRTNGGHAHWPVDPNTTARLRKVSESDPYAQSTLKDRYSLLRLALHGLAFLFIAGLFLISLVIIAEAVR